jgi:hypothetical protein
MGKCIHATRFERWWSLSGSFGLCVRAQHAVTEILNFPFERLRYSKPQRKAGVLRSRIHCGLDFISGGSSLKTPAENEEFSLFISATSVHTARSSAAQLLAHFAPHTLPLSSAQTYTQPQHRPAIIFSFQQKQLMGNMNTLVSKEASHRQRCPPNGLNRWVQLKTSGDGTPKASSAFMSLQEVTDTQLRVHVTILSPHRPIASIWA